MLISKGEILKRKFHDFREVTVIEVDTDYITIKDDNGVHFVKVNDIEHYFTRREPDQIVKFNATHGNIDDEKRHNIAGDMNRPDRAAEFSDK